MQIFHDRKADRITIVQEAHRILAWVLLAPMGAFFAVLGVYSWFAAEYGAGLLAVLCAASAVAMLWLAAWAMTEIVATFDGPTRVLTVRRERPWGTSSQAIAFADVYDLELTEVWMIEAIDHRLDIRLAGEGRVRLRFNAGDRDDVERAIADTRAMLRRATATAV